MSTSPQGSRDKGAETPPEPKMALYLLATMADTTWRMFVPVVGTLLVGRQIDRAYQTRPLAMIIGTILGVLITAVLIKRQLNRKS